MWKHTSFFQFSIVVSVWENSIVLFIHFVQIAPSLPMMDTLVVAYWIQSGPTRAYSSWAVLWCTWAMRKRRQRSSGTAMGTYLPPWLKTTRLHGAKRRKVKQVIGCETTLKCITWTFPCSYSYWQHTYVDKCLHVYVDVFLALQLISWRAYYWSSAEKCLPLLFLQRNSLHPR